MWDNTLCYDMYAIGKYQSTNIQVGSSREHYLI